MRVPATMARPRRLLAAAILAAAAVAGCDEDAEIDRPADASQLGAEEGAAAAGFTAVDPWVRVAIRHEGSDAAGAPPVNSAGYLVLRNPGPEADAIVAVETELADTAELHSVTMDGGIMRMRPVDSVSVAAGGGAVLEPGGYHIMLVGIRRELEEGDTVPLTLRLRSGATVDVRAAVLNAPPKP